jgi:Sec-independent protein translocase protein TatA
MSAIIIVAIILLVFGFKTFGEPKKEKYCAACLMR